MWAGDWLSERYEMERIRNERGERDAVEAKVRDEKDRIRRS